MKRIIAILLLAGMILTLSACGHKHVWEQATVDTPKICTICGITEGEALGYNWGEASYEWTEDNSSVTATRVSGTDASIVETETAIPSAEITKEPTFDEPGETTYTVSFENPAFETQTVIVADIEPLSHEWEEPSFSWSEDHRSMTATRICANDPSIVETETATVTSEVTKEPSSDEPGETTYTAAFENPGFPVQTWTVADIPPLNSRWSEAEYEWSEDGLTVTATRVSENDPTIAETEIASASMEVTKEPTCVEPGEVLYTVTFGNDAFAAQSWVEELAPLGHAWGETEYEWAEDNSSVTATRVCLADASHTETETAETSAEVTREPSFDEPGETTYSVSFENPDFEEQSRTVADLAPLDYNWGEISYDWAQDYSSVTATRVSGTDPNIIETETADADAKLSKAPSCGKLGETTYTVRFENPDFASQSVTLADVEALSHDWMDATYYAPKTCALCGETEGEALPVPYFCMNFAEFVHRFNIINNGFLKIYPDGFGNYYLLVEGASLDMFGIDNYFDVWHYDLTGLSTELADDGGLEHFNSLSFSYLSPSPEFGAPVARILPTLAFEFARSLDSSLTESEFLDGRSSLYSGNWENYRLSRNGYDYALDFVEVWNGMYRYEFTITPSDLIA